MSGVEITQADRDAAAALTYETMRGGLNWSSAKRIRDTIANGKWDAHYAVQAFARHRQSATAPLIAAGKDADRFARTVARVVRYACDTTESHRRKDAVIVPTHEWHRIMALAQEADELRERITETLAKHKGNSDGQG